MSKPLLATIFFLILLAPTLSAALSLGNAIDDLQVKGIVKTSKGNIAAVINPQNRNKLLRLKAGDLLYDGRVVRVEADKVIFCKETDSDPKTPCEEVIKYLHQGK